MTDPDAIVIGAGPNGLVAANLLSDAGWQVLVLEAESTPGGAVRSGEITEPGFVHDLFSAFYPLGVASPVMRRLDLPRWGVRWRHAPLVVANPVGDEHWAAISRDLDETSAILDKLTSGDGDAWRRFYGRWEAIGDAFLDAMTSPFPPIRASLSLAARLRTDLLPFARFAVRPMRNLASDEFVGSAPGLLTAGNALHADVPPDQTLSGMYGWVMACLAQQHGFPVPEGGAQQLTDALVRRLEQGTGRIVCDARVRKIVVERGRAVGVETFDGSFIGAERAVLADVGAPALYRRLLDPSVVPAKVSRQIDRFVYDPATVKVDWALDGPIPWLSDLARDAGTIHLCDSIDHYATTMQQIDAGYLPARPLVICGQMTVADPTRAPAGKHVVWAYAHLPHHVIGDSAGGDDPGSAAFADRIEGMIEERAPGFRDRIRQRVVMGPDELEASDANLVGGAINGGTARLEQQAIFRPIPGLGRAETPITDLYLASASAHPGGGVHGACGANAARAALARRRRRVASRALAASAAGALAAKRFSPRDRG